MSLFPAAGFSYLGAIGQVAAATTLIYALRASISRYAKLFTGASVEATGEDDLTLLGLAAGGIVFLVIRIIGLPLPLAATAAVLAGCVCPRIFKKRRRLQALKSFDSALSDSLQTVASSLRAGLTLKDSLFVAADNSVPEFRYEVTIALREYRFGLPIEEALDNLRLRVATANTKIAFGAMIISSRLGGRLPDMLKQIVRTIRERERVEGRLRALTAQGRAQAFLLCSAPPALGVGMWFYDRSKMELLTATGIGQLLLCLAIVLEIVGIAVTMRVMRLEV